MRWRVQENNLAENAWPLRGPRTLRGHRSHTGRAGPPAVAGRRRRSGTARQAGPARPASTWEKHEELRRGAQQLQRRDQHDCVVEEECADHAGEREGPDGAVQQHAVPAWGVQLKGARDGAAAKQVHGDLLV